MIEVSVVIPNYNSEKTIKKCVKSVLANKGDNFEVLVIDDKSTDKSRDILKKIKDKKLKVIQNKKNSGASYSRNFGIKNSKGEIVILLDSDSYVESDWVKKHYEMHKKISAEIIGGGMVGFHKTIYGKCDAYCNWWTSVPYSKNYFLKKLHLPTNNISFKKSIFEEIGYFRDELSQGGEDAEFCFRAIKNKIKIYFKSDLIAHHYDRDDYQGYIKHQEHFGKHAIEMRRKLKMDYDYLMPKNYLISHLYIIPLALLYTSFIISKWFKYESKIILYSPLIFLGKLKQTIEMKNSLKFKK